MYLRNYRKTTLRSPISDWVRMKKIRKQALFCADRVDHRNNLMGHLENYYSRYGFIGKKNLDLSNRSEKALSPMKIRKTLLLFVLGLLITILNTVQVYADSFYPSGDSAQCNFAVAESISIQSLPSVNDQAGGLKYQLNSVEGEGADYPTGHNIKAVAETSYPNARRFLGVADRVSAPPGSEVVVGFFPYNYAGHTVKVNGGNLFLSGAGGDWTKLIVGGASIANHSVTYKISGDSITKTGKAVNIGALGSYLNRTYVPGRVIYSMTIDEPVKILNQKVGHYFNSDNELITTVAFDIRNSSVENIDNLRAVFDDVILWDGAVSAGQTVPMTYEKNFGVDYVLPINIGHSSLAVSASQPECIEYGTAASVSHNPDNRLFIFDRDDSGVPSGWTGKQVDFSPNPAGDAMCITRTPYTRNTDDFILSVVPEVSGSINVTDNDEIEVGKVVSDVNENIIVKLKLSNPSVDISLLNWNILWNDEVSPDLQSSCTNGFNFDHNAVWECSLTGRLGESLAGQTLTGHFIAGLPDGHSQEIGSIIIEVREIPSVVSLVKSVSTSTITHGGTLEWQVDLSIEGVGVEGELTDVCDGCSMFGDIVSQSQETTSTIGVYIPPGVYRSTYQLPISISKTGMVRNCARFSLLSGRSYESCTNSVVLSALLDGVVNPITHVYEDSGGELTTVPGDLIDATVIVDTDSTSTATTSSGYLSGITCTTSECVELVDNSDSGNAETTTEGSLSEDYYSQILPDQLNSGVEVLDWGINSTKLARTGTDFLLIYVLLLLVMAFSARKLLVSLRRRA